MSAALAFELDDEIEQLAIYVHPFKATSEGETYCERYDPEMTGWSAYQRTPLDDGSFDIDWDISVPTFDEAMALAVARAGEIGLDPYAVIEDY